MQQYKRLKILTLFLPVFFLLCSTIQVETTTWTVTVSSDENGSVCESGTRQVTENDSVPLFVCQAAKYYSFKEWVILSGSANCTVGDKFNDSTMINNIRGPVSIKAIFELNSYHLAINPPEGNGKITVSPQPVNGTYADGQQITLIATADTGWLFESWKETSNSTVSSLTVVITNDTAISATFKEVSVPNGVICVWSNSSSTVKNGGNWAHAYTTIADAIAHSSSNSEIWIKQGTYNDSSYAPNAGTKFYGGFTGVESLLSQRNWQTHPTILDGQASNTTALDIANSGVVLNGLTITNYTGIAVNCSGNNTQIINCCIENNTGANAVYLRSTDNIVSNCIFKSNGLTSSSTFGRALYLSSASNNNTISNSLFFQNAGPAIRDDNTNKALASKINSCTIVKNGSSSISFPGGLKAKGATVLNGDIIYYNTNTGTSKYGRQIDSTYGVTSCGIQIANSKDTSGCGDLLNWATVITADPAFIADIPNSDLTTLADSTWYSTVTMSIPLLLNSSSSPLLNKYYGGAPSLDIRGVSRNSKIDIGAYESANPNQ